MFFETKSTTSRQGDIGVARSVDQGATWEFLGIALDEKWHLSYPFVFNYKNQVIKIKANQLIIDNTIKVAIIFSVFFFFFLFFEF